MVKLRTEEANRTFFEGGKKRSAEILCRRQNSRPRETACTPKNDLVIGGALASVIK